MENNKDRGFVCLWRSLLDWGWYSDANTFRVFMHLLLKANWRETEFMGRKIPRGSCAVGRVSLSLELGLSEQQIRTAFEHLKSTNEITTKSTSKFTIINIVKYSEYQDKDESEQPINNRETTNKQPRDNQQLTNTQPTPNQQATTSKQLTINNKQLLRKIDRSVFEVCDFVQNPECDSKESLTAIKNTKPHKPPKAKRQTAIVIVDEGILTALESNKAYIGIDVKREYHKMLAWFETARGAGKQPTKTRFINWLNRCEPTKAARMQDKPVQNSVISGVVARAERAMKESEAQNADN